MKHRKKLAGGMGFAIAIFGSLAPILCLDEMDDKALAGILVMAGAMVACLAGALFGHAIWNSP